MIKVRQATLADKPAIFEFLRKAYPENGRYKFPERWEWQFINNPFKPDNNLPVWIAIDEHGVVAGQSCAMYEPIKIGSNTCRLAWALDAYVLPEYRGQDLGFKVLEANCESHDLWMGLVMAESSRHILTKLGCRPTDTVPVYKHFVKGDAKSIVDALENNAGSQWWPKLLQWWVHLPSVDQFFSSLIDFRKRIQVKHLSRFFDSSIEITKVDRFDDNIDALWNRICSQFDVIIQRTKTFLNWKYIQQPFIDYQIFTASRYNRICGYIILRKTISSERNAGIIADLFVSREDKKVIQALLAFAVIYFYERDVKNIYSASSILEYRNVLTKFGFKKYKEAKPLLRSKDTNPITDILYKQASWFLGRSDHDWDQVLHE